MSAVDSGARKLRACIVVVFPQLDSDLFLFGKTTASLKGEGLAQVTLIGGKVKEGESAIDGAWREFVEEAGDQAAAWVKLWYKQALEVTVEANGWTYVAFIFVPKNRHMSHGDAKGVFYESLSKLTEKRARAGQPPLGELYGFFVYPVDQLVEKELSDCGSYPLDSETELVKYYDPLVLAVAKAYRALFL